MAMTAAVLALNEADFLDGCLVSLAWADELLVLVDAASRDRTAEVARRHTERVVELPFGGFPRQRNRALELAGGEWVLFVDADERVPPALAAETRRAIGDRPEAAGFWIPRRNLIRGHWVRYAGWWPDRQLRLLRRGQARYDESTLVHEVAQLDGPAGTLTEPLIHLNYETLAEFQAKQARYARLEARSLWQQGHRARPHNLVLQPLRELRRRLLDLDGYRQGRLGLELSASMAAATFLTYRELLRLARNAEPDASGRETGTPTLSSSDIHGPTADQYR